MTEPAMRSDAEPPSDTAPWLADWQSWLSAEKRFSDHTCDAYGRDLSFYLSFLSEQKARVYPPNRLMFRQWLATQQSAHSHATIARRISAIRSFYRFYHRRSPEHLPDISWMKAPKRPHTIPKAPTKQEMSSLLDAVFKRPLADWQNKRDFAVLMLMYGCGLRISEVLSITFAEELVIWSSAQFRFVTLSDRFSTGSSIMPQKKNPDAAELIRAKIGRIFGANVALMMVMKGLPLTYSKDMQEDKEQVFDAADNLMLALAAMSGMVGDMTANQESLKTAAASGFSTATDLADWLVRALGMPFRDAHHVTGSLVAMAEEQGCDLPDLTLAQMQSVHPQITSNVFEVLGVENSVASRLSYGGTAPAQVRSQIARWEAILS